MTKRNLKIRNAEIALETARALITGTRREAYGDECLPNVASRWKKLFPDSDITPAKTAIAMAELKLARLNNCIDHTDSIIDAIGYLALAYEFTVENDD